MPKKTRKEKLQSLERKQRYSGAPQNEIRQESKTVVSESQKEEDAHVRKYFIQDFRKSLTLVGLIIAVELAFYYASQAGLLTQYLPL